MKFMLCHLTGSQRGQTQYFDTTALRFGSSRECGVVFDPQQDRSVLPQHAELSVLDHRPILRSLGDGSAVFVNGQSGRELVLEDGDLMQFGDQGPLVRFRVLADDAAEEKAWRHIVADSRDIVVRTPRARYFRSLHLIRHLLADVVRYASPRVKIASAIALLAPVLVIAVLSVAVYRQHQASRATEQRMAELSRQLETGRMTRADFERRVEREREMFEEIRRQQEALMAKLTAALKPEDQPRGVEREVAAVRRQLSQLQQGERIAEDLVRRFAGAVGLLQGGYGFRDRETGRLLRYRGMDAEGNPLEDKDGNALVTIEGTAPPVVIYYAGTAFLVDDRGTVITNRHLVQMWETFAPARRIIEAGFEPDLRLLRLFLPGETQPYNLQVAALSDAQRDLAVLLTDRKPTGRLVLVLASADEPIRAGEPLTMLSYPGSLDALLARAPIPVSREMVAEAHGQPPTLAEEAARRNLIRPLATQGHVSDVTKDLIAYTAVAATGSSGAPIFNRAGKVIGVNHAMIERAEGVQLALPVRFVHGVLAQSQGQS